MRSDEFNVESEKAEFIYKPSPLSAHSYQIFQYHQGQDNYTVVGTYTVLDLEEAQELSEKRVMNLIAVMNGRKRTIDLSSLTNSRIFFNIIPARPEDMEQKVIFRAYDGTGVSEENAILVIDRGVFDEWT